MRLVDKDDILKDIEDLQKSPWYNDGEDVESGRRLQYNIRKEAVEIVRDMCVKVAPIIDAIPVEWMREKMNLADDAGDLDSVDLISWLIQTWHKEQEADHGNV